MALYQRSSASHQVRRSLINVHRGRISISRQTFVRNFGGASFLAPSRQTHGLNTVESSVDIFAGLDILRFARLRGAQYPSFRPVRPVTHSSVSASPLVLVFPVLVEQGSEYGKQQAEQESPSESIYPESIYEFPGNQDDAGINDKKK